MLNVQFLFISCWQIYNVQHVNYLEITLSIKNYQFSIKHYILNQIELIFPNINLYDRGSQQLSSGPLSGPRRPGRGSTSNDHFFLYFFFKMIKYHLVTRLSSLGLTSPIHTALFTDTLSLRRRCLLS